MQEDSRKQPLCRTQLGCICRVGVDGSAESPEFSRFGVTLLSSPSLSPLLRANTTSYPATPVRTASIVPESSTISNTLAHLLPGEEESAGLQSGPCHPMVRAAGFQQPGSVTLNWRLG